MGTTREHWGSRFGFLMATVGSAIGLGSFWKFPYVTGENGGGAFVLTYIIAILFVCVPLFIAELLIGRSTQRGAVSAFIDLAPTSQNWKFVGWLAIFSTFMIFSYYSVAAGWTVNYALLSLNEFTVGRTPEQIRDVFDVLYKSADVNLLWHFVFMLLNVGIVYGGIRKGIEYWSRILMPTLMIILLGLFCYSVTLEGFSKAFHFIFYPDMTRFSSEGVIKALGMAFFTSSLGMGIIVTYGSYMRPADDIPKMTFLVEAVNVGVSLFAAMMIFPIIFTFGFEPDAGPGLVFKTLPVLFAKLPGTVIISTVFFLLLVFAALTSSISLLEVLVSNCMELFDWSRHKAVLLCGAAVFVVGIPSALSGAGALFPTWTEMYGVNFFDTISQTWDKWFLPVNGFFVCLFVGWVFPKKRRYDEFFKGSKWGHLYRPWLFLIRWVAPTAILIFMFEAVGLLDIGAIVSRF